MKLVQQTTLVFGSAAKQKVFEIDLCEVGAASFVVNFRYGRAGGRLKDGSKTPAPVSRERASAIFAELVEAKQQAGYAVSDSFGAGGAAVAPAAAPTAAAPVAAPAPGAVTADTDDGRGAAEGVLARLRQGDGRVEPLRRRVLSRSAERAPWPLERAIWRAGELGLVEAVEPLLELLLRNPTPLRSYAIVWALARCSPRPATARVMAALQAARTAYRDTTMVRRIATEALLMVGDDATVATLRAELQATLPRALREALERGPQAFVEAFDAHMRADSCRHVDDALTVYRLEPALARPALLAWLRETKLAPNTFRAVRQVFKAAELRLDAEVFGIIAHRFETTRAFYASSRYGAPWRRASAGGEYVRVDAAELGRDEARFAYGTRTRAYLRRRVWRTLRRLGELGRAEDYVKMAVGLLLPWQDEGPGTLDEDGVRFYWSLCQVLFGGATQRGVPAHGALKWRWTIGRGQRQELQRRRALGHAVPREREEAFAALWDACPLGLLHLLDESRCELVHIFASRALLENRNRIAQALDLEALLMLLESAYPVTARAGFELVADRHDPQAPDLRLVLAVANSAYARGRANAFSWIEANRRAFIASTPFVCGLVASPQADTRAFARRWLRSSALEPGQARDVVARLVAMLMGAREPEHEAHVADIAHTLHAVFGRELATLGEAVVRDLLGHPLEAVQVLGGDALAIHATLATNPPEDLLAMLLDSEHAAVRAAGVRLLHAMDEAVLRERPLLLVVLTLNKDATLRDGARALIERLTARYAGFGRAFAESLIEALVRRKAVAGGVGPHLVWLFGQVLEPHLEDLAPERVWALLRARSPVAQELGGLLVPGHLRPQDLTVDEMARLATHEIRSVREAGWAMYRGGVERLREDMLAAVRILDTRWQDTLAFAFELFASERFTAEDYSPSVLLGIIDSPEPSVQRFGQMMLTRCFPEAHGEALMLALGEHPSGDVQLMVTNYLERFAAGRPDNLRQLEAYFRMALGRVNKGGLTRARLYAFLEREALLSEEAAVLVAQLMTRQSASIAIEDRARAIAILTAIRESWPAVAVPLVVHEPEVRRGVQL